MNKKGVQYRDWVIGEMIKVIQSDKPFLSKTELINQLAKLNKDCFKSNSFYKRTPKIFSGELATLHWICFALHKVGFENPFEFIQDNISLSILAPCEWIYGDVRDLNRIFHTQIPDQGESVSEGL